MKTLPVLVLVLLLLGAATLFAEPEDVPEVPPPLGLGGEIHVSEGQVEALVNALAEKPTWQVRVEATFMRMDAERASEILGEHRPERMGSARQIPEMLARQLVGRARGHGAIRPEPLPPLVLYAGLTGRLTATGLHAYLQDYEVECGMGGKRLTGPIVSRMEDGTRLDVTPHRAGKRLHLDVDACWADVVRPIPLFVASVPYSQEKFTIELPELGFVHLKEEVELPADGGYVLAGRGFAWDGESLRLVVLQVRKATR